MGDVPIFIKIDDYKHVLDTVNGIKQKLEEAKSLLADIEELKSEEQAEIQAWRHNLEEVDAKIEFIDKTLFELNM